MKEDRPLTQAKQAAETADSREGPSPSSLISDALAGSSGLLARPVSGTSATA